MYVCIKNLALNKCGIRFPNTHTLQFSKKWFENKFNDFYRQLKFINWTNQKSKLPLNPYNCEFQAHLARRLTHCHPIFCLLSLARIAIFTFITFTFLLTICISYQLIAAILHAIPIFFPWKHQKQQEKKAQPMQQNENNKRNNYKQKKIYIYK